MEMDLRIGEREPSRVVRFANQVTVHEPVSTDGLGADEGKSESDEGDGGVHGGVGC